MNLQQRINKCFFTYTLQPSIQYVESLTNISGVHEDVIAPQKAQTLGGDGNPEHAKDVLGEEG
jgi:hypothetical protein